MAEENPYEPPRPASADWSAKPSMMIWGVGVVFGASLIGGVTGLLLGAVLGTVLPGYYRSVFWNGESPNFDPLAVGIGQGLTQGVVFGGVVGMVLVAIFYWHRSRMLPKTEGK